MKNNDSQNRCAEPITDPRGLHASLYFDEADVVFTPDPSGIWLMAGKLSGDISADIFRKPGKGWWVDLRTGGLNLHPGAGALPAEDEEDIAPEDLVELLAPGWTLGNPNVTDVDGSPRGFMTITWTASAKQGDSKREEPAELETQFNPTGCPNIVFNTRIRLRSKVVVARSSRPGWKDWMKGLWTGATYLVPGSEFPAALPNDCETVSIMLAYLRNHYYIGECDVNWNSSARCRRMGDLYRRLRRYHSRNCR